MTRRDVAVLLFVGFGFYCLLEALGYLSGPIQLLAPPVRFPLGFIEGIQFASYVVPFALLLAGGVFLISARERLAQQLFEGKEDADSVHEQSGATRLLGPLAFTGLGLLAFVYAIRRLMHVLQFAQPSSWRELTAARFLIVSELHLLTVGGLIGLGWYLLTRREHLTKRWLLSTEASRIGDPHAAELRGALSKILGIFFLVSAVSPLARSAVAVAARGVSAVSPNPWGFWPDIATGIANLVVGIGLVFGKEGIALAWRKLVAFRET